MAALVVIHKHQFSSFPARRQKTRVFDVDLAQAVAHLRRLREAPRNKSRPNGAAVYREGEVGEHALRVRLLFLFGKCAVAVGIDSGDDGRRHQNARNQPHGRLNTIGFERENRGLQILVDPVGERESPQGERHAGDGG